MRLKNNELEFIKNTIKNYIQDAKIYIFGSRLDDTKRGGDIDIFIITTQKVDFGTKGKIKFILEEKLFKPIDLVFHKDFKREIEKEALNGIEI